MIITFEWGVGCRVGGEGLKAIMFSGGEENGKGNPCFWYNFRKPY